MDTTHQKLLALSFDDGPNDTTMIQIMDLLKQHQANATFFVVGNHITARSAPVLKLAAEQGFEIGNHSRSHLHMSGIGREEVLQEVRSVQMQVEQAIGMRPSLFRPPYLDYDEQMLERIPMPFIAGTANYDWEPDCTVDRRVSLAMDAAEDGAILLMHCFEGNDATVQALHILLPALKQLGYRIVSVSELFARKGITLKAGSVYQNACKTDQ